MMKTTSEGVALLHRFESCRLEAYPDPKSGGDPWTIGWGHTGPEVRPGLVWTQDQADAIFEQDLARFERSVQDLVDVPLEEHENDALVSFTYNLGERRLRDSTLLRMLNNDEDKVAIADQFLRWVSPGSTVEKGLRRRRVAERARFLGRDWRAELDAHVAAGG